MNYGREERQGKREKKGAENICNLLCLENAIYCSLYLSLEHRATWSCRKRPKEVKLLDLIKMWETQTVKECAGKVL